MDFYTRLTEIVDENRVLVKEPMSLHTTFKIGGPADFLVRPQSERELSALLSLCREASVPWFLLGNGSNLLVSDRGVRGVVIKLWRPTEAVTVLTDEAQETQEPRQDGEETTALSDGTKPSKPEAVPTQQVYISAGALLSRAAFELANMGLDGFAFAAGIPGTVGGAVVMNAGAYGGEIKDFLVSARVMDENGDIREVKKEALSLGYRTSALQGMKAIVLGARFSFPHGNREEILSQMEALHQQRREKQPLEYPSAGSTFKRPEGYFAGKLIMDAGLAGYAIGDAKVSEKHCGFVINQGNASAAEVLRLMTTVSDRVYEQNGVRLQPEVRLLGEFDI